MIALILIIAVLIGGTALAMYVRQDAGYVMIGYGQWSVEMSFILFVVAMFVATGILYYVFRGVGGTVRVPKRMRRWRQHRNAKKSHDALTAGLMEQAAGNWKKSEKILLNYIRDSFNPRPAYLAAAWAAHAQGAIDRRDQYLKMAHNPGDKDAAIDLTQAKMQFEQGQLKECLDTLLKLRKDEPKNDQVFELLVKTYAKLGDWKTLSDMLPEISRRHILHPERYLELERRVYEHVLNESLKKNDTVELHNTWGQLPKYIRQDVELLTTYLRNLIARGEHGMAEPQVREAIKNHWSDELIYLYGVVEGVRPEKQLAFAEGLLREQPDNPVLLLTLGRISARAELWGKAKNYLESSLEGRKHPETYYYLAKVLERTDDNTEIALEYYRKGLEAASNVSEQRNLVLGVVPA